MFWSARQNAGMPKTKLHGATLGGSADQVEAAFYDALQCADLDALMACWADEDEVVCVHPGGPRLVGVDAIRSSFAQILGHGAVHAKPERVHKVESSTSAVHNLIERVDVFTSEGVRHAYVIASNVYYKTVQGWRLVLHHASPATADAPDQGADTVPQTFH